MRGDNLVELIEPMLNSAGAAPLALYIHNRTQAWDDRLPCLKNPRPEGAESSLTESASSPFQAEPAQFPGFLHNQRYKFEVPQGCSVWGWWRKSWEMHENLLAALQSEARS